MPAAARSRIGLLALTLLAVLLLLPGCASAPARPGTRRGAHRLPLAPCRVQGTQEKLLCGSHAVWEDRAARAGRKIDLHVVVVPARAAHPAPDPVFIFVGGPGGAATRRASWYVDAPLRERRDLVFIDQRGTGRSNPLDCPMGEGAKGEPGELREIFPVADVEACRKALASRADVTLYTTPIAVDDFDEVRRWLGYGKVNLVGGSYASLTVQTYLQRHPGSVRAAFSQAVLSLERSGIRDQAVNAQRVLDALLDACARDATCGAAFPHLGDELAGLFARLGRSPAPVQVTDPVTGEALSFELGKDYLAEHVRRSLYFLSMARALPMAIHLAYQGDYGPIARLSLLFDHGYGGLSTGVLLTAYCTEQMGTFAPADAVAEADRTIFGSFRIRQQIQACEHWPTGRLPADFHRPHSVDVPTLLVAGELDPVNPPRYAQEALRHLPRGRLLVVPEAHHGLGGLENPGCVVELEREFLERGSAKGLDTSCLATVHRKPFLTDRQALERHLAELAEE